MSHFFLALAITLLAAGVVQRPVGAALIGGGSSSDAQALRPLRALPRTVDLAAVTALADDVALVAKPTMKEPVRFLNRRRHRRALAEVWTLRATQVILSMG